jgi:hypothetical protein
MSGVGQAVFMNQRSFGPPPPGAIGSAYQGGFYAGDISTTANGVATDYLIVGPLSTAQQTSTQWKNANTATAGADSDIDGPQNTADMVADGNATVYPAAHFCNNLTIGGFSDWYMPANNELEVCYYNLKPTTTNNRSGLDGINPNAVPARASAYTTGNPAQTSAAAFQSGGSEAFAAQNYWSSTEFSGTSGRRQFFGAGDQYNPFKTNAYRVRAVRRLAV